MMRALIRYKLVDSYEAPLRWRTQIVVVLCMQIIFFRHD